MLASLTAFLFFRSTLRDYKIGKQYTNINLKSYFIHSFFIEDLQIRSRDAINSDVSILTSFVMAT